MTWFRVDDTLAAHQKVRRAGVPAMGLWVLAGAHCSQQLTDGFVPEWFVIGLPSGRKYADALVAAGLWSTSVVDGEKGWQFHDWHQANPTRAQVLADREKAKRRQQSWRDKHRDDAVSHTVRNAVTDAVSNSVSNAAPTRPDPSLPTTAAATDAGTRLIAAYVARHGVLPRQVKQRLGEQIDALVADGISEQRICTALDQWARKRDAAPGLLPHLVPKAVTELDPHKEHLREMS